MIKVKQLDFYTSFIQRGDSVYVRHYKNGVQCQSEFKIHPKLYIETPRADHDLDTPFRNIAGKPIYELSFDNPKAAKTFMNSYSDSSMQIYGYPRFDYAEIDKLFPGEIDFDYDQIRVVAIDIETEVDSPVFPDDTIVTLSESGEVTLGQYRKDHSEQVFDIDKREWSSYEDSCYAKGNGFPDIFDPKEVINLFSLSFRGHIYAFGLKPWGLTDENVTYVHCKSEEVLLKALFGILAKIKPDIITGWNIDNFDIPYIYNRTIKVLNQDWANKLSPLGWCRASNTSFSGRDSIKIDVNGIQIVDYLELYKKFELSPRENYKLDTIAMLELGENKIELDCPFKESYSDKNWDRHVRYNIQDTRLIDRLDEKLQFIRVAATMALSAKCNFTDVYRVTRIWDNIIANHLREQNIHVAAQFSHNSEGYEGAYVKPTVPGLYKWCASFDVASLYPSMIVQYNISPDTILDSMTFHPITAADVLNNTPLYQEALADAISKNATLCANGSMYSKDKQGFLGVLVEKYFTRRVEAKKEMKKWGKEAERAKEEIKRRASNV